MVSKPPRNLTHHGEVDFYESLRKWSLANAALVDQRKGRDDFDLSLDSKALFLAYWAISDAVEKTPCEYTQRRGVDALIQSAFASRLGATHEVWCVCMILPHSLTQEM
jgi:hypothetical protein